jgi:G3E family GTPase
MSQYPVTVLTGFLGSGKSTLLNRMLRSPEMANAAVIINEFGEVSIDHLLVETAIENMLVLQSGCICCSIRGDLVDTLLDLEAKRDRGEIPRFDRVVVETTGLADTPPILHTIVFDPAIGGRYDVDGVITTVDASNVASQVERFGEAQRQVAFADMLVLTKTDLCEGPTIDAARRKIRALNPAAEMLIADHGETDFARFFAIAKSRESGAGHERWLSADAYEGAESHRLDEDARDSHRDRASRFVAERARDDHIAGIRAFCLTFEEPLDLARLKEWLVSITSLRGENLLRVKGIVHVRQIAEPVVIQGVQHVLYPPTRLERPIDALGQSRLVFITQGIPVGALEASTAFLEIGTGLCGWPDAPSLVGDLRLPELGKGTSARSL